MKKPKQTMSLRRQMVVIILVCWLLPVLMAVFIMGWYLISSLGQGAKQSLSEQFQVNLQMCADRVDSAVEASRLASYDSSIKDAWETYELDGWYPALYKETQAFLNRQYGSDSRFQFSTFWFSENPEEMTLATSNGVSGSGYTEVRRFWSEDFEAAKTLALNLDTAVGFLERDGRVYLVRNLMDSDYRTMGVLVLALNFPYYFEDMGTLPWVSSVEVTLGADAAIAVLGEIPADARDVIQAVSDGNGYKISARAGLNYGVLLAPFTAYIYLFVGMLLLLLPMLLITFQFFKQKVNEPVEKLMAGAAQIEQGKLGYQLSYQANSREFQYLIDSYNHMSGQLQHQFNRLYQEELALRDAHIKALQAHINPHFLNNTLEIINWEARMGENTKVSRMIESLSTVLDAALDRNRKPEVRLAEEMTYVNAYLYIITERFGKRINVSIDLPEALMDFKVPRLILQPVIENAVEHGIGPSGHGTVSIRGYKADGCLILEIENGGGLSAQDEAHIERLLAADYDAGRETSGNIGIANVNQRLRILYGDGCGLSIFRSEGSQVIARLRISVSEEKD